MENIDLFDRYYQKKLPEEEVIQFEERLSSDPQFSEEYSDYVLMITGLRFSNQSDLFDQMTALELGLKRRNKIRVLSIISTAAAIFMGVFFMFNLQSNDTNLAVYDDFYTPYKPSRVLSRDSQLFYSTDSAIVFYLDGEIERSKEIFDRIQVDSSTELQLYKGLVYLELGLDEQAYSLFKIASADTNFIFQEDVLWYNLLICVKMDKKKEVDQLSRQLIESDGRYKDKVLQILEAFK